MIETNIKEIHAYLAQKSHEALFNEIVTIIKKFPEVKEYYQYHVLPKDDHKAVVFDNNHKEVKVKSWVKVLSIDLNFISTFPPKEAKKLRSMLNNEFEVTDIQHGKALVYQRFNRNSGFSLALSSEEMELVDNL